MGLSSPACNCSPAFQDCFSLQSLREMPTRSSQPELNSSLGRRETLHLRDRNIFSKTQGPSIKAREIALSLPRSYSSQSSLKLCRRRSRCGILQLLIALTLPEKSLSFLLLVGIFFCSPNHCWFWLIWRMGSEIHCFSSFRNHLQGFDARPVWLKAGPTASLKVFLNLSTIPGWFSNLKQKPSSGKVCKFLGCIRKLLYNLR